MMFNYRNSAVCQRSSLVLVLAVLVVVAGCRTNDDAEPTPQHPGPTLQPGVVDTEPIVPDPLAEGVPDWDDYQDESKFDIALATRISEVEEQNGRDTIQVIVELRDPFSDEIRDQMHAAGLQTYMTEGYAIAAAGTPEALRTMTVYDYVTGISLSGRPLP